MQMIKKIPKFICFMILLMLSSTLIACQKDKVEIEYFPYVFEEDGEIITSYSIKKMYYRPKDLYFDDIIQEIVIPETYNDIEVTYLLPESINVITRRLDLNKIKVIQSHAFSTTCVFYELDLSEVEIIEEYGIMYTRTERLTIPKSVKYIGDYNFYFKAYIKEVYFEGNPEYIAPTVFNLGSEYSYPGNLIIYGPSGGTVEEFAKNNNVKFEVWDANTKTK